MPWYDRPVSPDHVLVLGLIMCAWGYYTKLIWPIFGGVLLFMLGIIHLPKEKGEEGLHEKGGES